MSESPVVVPLPAMTISPRRSMTQQAAGYGLLAPAMIAISLLLVFPLAYSAWLSLTDAALLSSETTFVGLRNYSELLVSPEFMAALWHDVVYTLATTALSVGLGLGFALLMSRSFAGKSWLSALVILPYLIPSVATFLIFKWQLNTTFGIVNEALLQLRLISQPVSWLGNPSLAMFTVIMVSSWAFFPFAYIAFLARLQTIPPSLYDAACVDGANVFSRFRYVTLPQLRNTLVMVVLLRGIWIFNNFDMIWLLTGGGPRGVTEHLPIRIYRDVFISHSLSRGAATAMVMFVILVVVSSLYFLLFARPQKGRQ